MRDLRLGMGFHAAGSAWTPAQLGAKLAVWLDPYKGVYSDLAGTTLCNNGDAVALWKDQSGNGNNFNQSVAGARPIYSTTALGGKAALTTGVSANHRLVCVNNSSSYLSGSGAERWLVKKELANPPVAGDGSSEINFGVDSSTTHIPYTDGNIYDAFASTTRQSFARGIDVSQPFIYASLSGAGLWTAYGNGAQLYTTGANTFFADSAKAQICGTSGSLSDGVFSEWVICNAVLTAGERANVKNYLSNKYGIAVT
jgi:hypothetical protein